MHHQPQETIMFRPILCVALALASFGCVAHDDANAQATSAATADKIADAMRAAPPAIAQHATIMDRPATPGGEPALLRAGSNGWTCTPSSDAARKAGRPNPSCVDEHARAWFAARSARQLPGLRTVGLNYRLMGDDGASNIDPFASGPSADNEWVVTGPHIIIFVPDVADLDGFPSDPASGGPYVMWRGTPYAHIMMPVAAPLAAQEPK
jgi:hypothetical protein